MWDEEPSSEYKLFDMRYLNGAQYLELLKQIEDPVERAERHAAQRPRRGCGCCTQS